MSLQMEHKFGKSTKDLAGCVRQIERSYYGLRAALREIDGSSLEVTIPGCWTRKAWTIHKAPNARCTRPYTIMVRDIQ